MGAVVILAVFAGILGLEGLVYRGGVDSRHLGSDHQPNRPWK
jgi:hypothetical protein